MFNVSLLTPRDERSFSGLYLPDLSVRRLNVLRWIMDVKHRVIFYTCAQHLELYAQLVFDVFRP